jgi:hypothetical protein
LDSIHHNAQDPDLVGMCSSCGYLGYCVERLSARRYRILICAECRAIERGEPMLPLAPMPKPRPPARETGKRAQPAKRRRVS